MNLAPIDRGGPKHPVPGLNGKPRKDRLTEPLEKIFLLVRSVRRDAGALGMNPGSPTLPPSLSWPDGCSI